MSVENYHLKWDSHHTHLNSSVTTLYKNEKYADVVLYSCNISTSNNTVNHIPTVGISAHKFILSSCSQYFSTIFETSPVSNHGVFYIVLPPDLSHRAIQILVQYMYMGEATVSNDILSEVLRGGEMLKIRGLCRTNSATNSSGVGNSVGAYNSTLPPVCLNGGTTSVRYLIEQQQQQQQRGLAATALPKDSPVIIKSPKPLSLLTVSSGSGLKNSNAKTNGSVAGGITVNKEVAIDPEDKGYYTSIDTAPPKAALMESSSLCNEIGCNNCPLSTDNRTTHPLQPLSPPQHSRNIISHREHCENDEPPTVSCAHELNSEFVENIATNNHRIAEHENDIRKQYEHEMRRVSQSTECPENMPDYTLIENYKIFANITPPLNMGRLHSPSHLSNQCKFTNIKQEPIEWLPSPTHVTTMRPSTNKKSNQSVQQKALDFKLNDIKTETVLNSCYANNTVEEQCTPLLPPPPPPPAPPPSSPSPQPPPPPPPLTSVNDYDRYFSCDTCNETFEDLTTLSRHSDNHANTSSSKGCSLNDNKNHSSTVSNSGGVLDNISKSYVPKKRRRISESNIAEPVALQCDLCNTSFETAAEWVRHINCQHTESELAIFNNKKDKEHKLTSSSSTIINDNNHTKKLSNNRQQQQRMQSRTTSMNSSTNVTNSSVINTASALIPPASSQTNVNINEYLRSTLSPA